MPASADKTANLSGQKDVLRATGSKIKVAEADHVDSGWYDVLGTIQRQNEGGDWCCRAQTVIKRRFNPHFEAQMHQQLNTLV